MIKLSIILKWFYIKLDSGIEIMLSIVSSASHRMFGAGPVPSPLKDGETGSLYLAEILCYEIYLA